MQERKVLTVVEGGRDDGLSKSADASVEAARASKRPAKTLLHYTMAEAFHGSSLSDHVVRNDELTFSPRLAGPQALGRTPSLVAIAPNGAEAINVSFAEIFEHIQTPLWPLGGGIVLKAALALSRLPRNPDPEQAGIERIALTVEGNVIVDGFSPGDVRALQLLATWLYRFSTGRFPAVGERLPPSRVNGNLPRWVDQVCVRGLTAQESIRYQSLAELIEDLQEHRVEAPRRDLNKLVRNVFRLTRPSVEELAEELTVALQVLTFPPPPSRKFPWWKVVAAVGFVGCIAAAVWQFVIARTGG